MEGTGADHSIAILVILFVVTLARESSSSRLGVGRSPSKSPTVGMTGWSGSIDWGAPVGVGVEMAVAVIIYLSINLNSNNFTL